MTLFKTLRGSPEGKAQRNNIIWKPLPIGGLRLLHVVMYDRRVGGIVEDDSVCDEFIWREIYDGKKYLYPRLLFIITGNCFSPTEVLLLL